MLKSIFTSADILLPKPEINQTKWAVVACDQFTSEPEYWHTAEDFVGDSPSALRITLPEIYLKDNLDKRIADININMGKYLEGEIFNEYKDAMIYVERTLPDGKVRKGIIGAIDLEAYEYTKDSDALVRATEGTVLERIPPRVKIRENAPLELPHVMLLIDDPYATVIEPLSKIDLTVVYDFDLMLGGGHIIGRLVDSKTQERIYSALEALKGHETNPLLFAVGDGNHSLATAKACYDKDKNPLNRFALTEFVNIHDDALEFEPIYRVLTNVDVNNIIESMKKFFGENGTQKIFCYYGDKVDEINVKPLTALPVGTLQLFIDDYLVNHQSVEVDYIHGVEVARKLAHSPSTVAFVFEGMSKSELFSTVKSDGSLPRKTFSMGEASSKRYYMECRRIK